MERIQAHRTFYARLITANAGIANPEHPVAKAFASVPRERFVGHGPWQIFTATGYVETPSDDPAFIYQDIVIALDRDKQLNNGQPILHAVALNTLAVKPGDVVVHVGAGTGYYTAVLASLAGPDGKVVAYEIDSDLAVRAAANLLDMRNVTVIAASATDGSLAACDAMYVNAATTGPLDSWLDALKVGGRLVLPVSPADVAGRPAPGMMLLITRSGERTFEARFVLQVAFTPCIGARDAETATRLTAAFARGDARNVRSLRRDGAPDDTCWCTGNGWWLSTAVASPAS